jgi:hypothetical protein
MIVFSYGNPVDLFEAFSFIATFGHFFSVIVIVAGIILSMRCLNAFVPKELRQ